MHDSKQYISAEATQHINQCHDSYDTAKLAVIKIAKALLASTANCSCS